MNIPELKLLIEVEWSEHGDYYKHKHIEVFPYTENRLDIMINAEKTLEMSRCRQSHGLSLDAQEHGAIYELGTSNYLASYEVRPVLAVRDKVFKLEEVNI